MAETDDSWAEGKQVDVFDRVELKKLPVDGDDFTTIKIKIYLT